MTEVVRPADGDPVAPRPCPAWCTQGRHFADGTVIHADDGYHHAGAEIEVPTSYPFLGMTDGAPTIVRAVLTSWTHPLGAEPGPVLIELNLGTAAERTDMCAEITPDEAEAVARALLDLAATAWREGPAAAGGMIFTSADHGQLAWTWVEYGNGGPPLRTAAVPHTERCAPGCVIQHAPACWIEAVFDAADAYRDDHGGPGALNQRLVTALGQWLDTQAVRWSWRSQGDPVLHDGQDGLAGLALVDK